MQDLLAELLRRSHGVTVRPAIIETVQQSKFVCATCGAGRDCDYNAPGRKRDAAVEAIAANPGKSDRAIAAETGLNREIVRRARKATDTGVAVDQRTGLHGKTRKLPAKADKGEPAAKGLVVAAAKSALGQAAIAARNIGKVGRRPCGDSEDCEDERSKICEYCTGRCDQDCSDAIWAAAEFARATANVMEALYALGLRR